MSKTTPAALASTLLHAAREWTSSRGHLALVDAYALLLTTGRGSAAYIKNEDPHLVATINWLAECLGHEPNDVERRAFATCLRVVAREWTAEQEAEGLNGGDVTVHLWGALHDDAGRDWGTSTTLPADREARAEWARAQAALVFSATAGTERAPAIAANDFSVNAAAAE